MEAEITDISSITDERKEKDRRMIIEGLNWAPTSVVESEFSETLLERRYGKK